ncbi:MAG: hypothetical protein CEE38_15380 [Planctomycetes bacterium B3_Pla]|nr:MAG: hypothetical protein CEE38_15380 [Planctomycetes bacterium B3_Pla]
MKEIDFLPEWYKSGIRREVSYRTQHLALAGMYAMMIVWSFAATYSVSRAKAESVIMAKRQAEAESVSARVTELESELRVLQKKGESIKEIDSRIDVANVLGEMSFLIGERIVLSKVEFLAEKFADEPEAKSAASTGAVVRAVRRTKSLKRRDLPLGDVRFKVVIAGVAADAGDVAALICKLEDSPYFCQVIPSFSRSATVESNRATPAPAFRVVTGAAERTPETGKGTVRVSEFEMNCYLANYRKYRR